MKNPDKNKALILLQEELALRYGEIMGGKELWRALGYRTPQGFKQAIIRNTLSLPTFFVVGRKGRYALTSDVATWLIECRSNVGKPSPIEVPETFKRKKLA